MNISLMIYACTLTWILSLIAVPAYFANFGEGSPKYNAIMMLGMTLTNITLSFMLGSFFGLIGVMFSFFISQFMGMIFLNFNFYRRHNLSIKKLGLISFSKSFTLLLFSFIAGLFLLSINANLFYILIHSCITLLLVFIIILKTDDSKLVLNLIK